MKELNQWCWLLTGMPFLIHSWFPFLAIDGTCENAHNPNAFKRTFVYVICLSDLYHEIWINSTFFSQINIAMWLRLWRLSYLLLLTVWRNVRPYAHDSPSWWTGSSSVWEVLNTSRIDSVMVTLSLSGLKVHCLTWNPFKSLWKKSSRIVLWRFVCFLFLLFFYLFFPILFLSFSFSHVKRIFC